MTTPTSAPSDRPIVLLSGKGGVGKTTVAAATARTLAANGARTLLVSTDPAHSIGDALGSRLTAEPTAVEERLDALELDPERVAAEHLDAVEDAVADRVDPELWPQVRRHLRLARDSPGTAETATFERVAALLERCPGEYDRLVVDTAPTGHTLRLLTLPALLGAWVEGLVRQRERVTGTERMLRNLAGREEPEQDTVLVRLRERRDRLGRAAERLREDTAVWLVVVPERLPIEETVRARSQLADHGLAVAGVVVNRVLGRDADGRFLAERREQQADYLAEITRRFGDLPCVHLPELPRDIADRASLDRIADALAASDVA
ncbi:ArsA family ATPase [Egibacter rhizosphaerae]|uniref:ArsA family ATPase n=1 Tax=Egibacter rhizosphaerae TaxID=1670831 RepID=UPI0013F160A8|nr:ArsA family ATPase [Egibacter rhizosphaerae]